MFEFSRQEEDFLRVLNVCFAQSFLGFFLAQLLESPFKNRVDVRNIDLRHWRHAGANRFHLCSGQNKTQAHCQC